MRAAAKFFLALAGTFLVALIGVTVAGVNLQLALAIGFILSLLIGGTLLLVDRRRGERRQRDRRATPQPLGPGVMVSGHGVVSFNQSGGQTAGSIVNVGPQPRTFRGTDLTSLRSYLAGFAGTEVDLSCALGDGDAATFAEELKALLADSGWKVDGVSHAVRIPPTVGVQLGFPGSDPSRYPWVRGLGERLLRLGIACHGGTNASNPTIHVGHRP